jgi:hypothetical protein
MKVLSLKPSEELLAAVLPELLVLLEEPVELVPVLGSRSLIT